LSSPAFGSLLQARDDRQPFHCLCPLLFGSLFLATSRLNAVPSHVRVAWPAEARRRDRLRPSRWRRTSGNDAEVSRRPHRTRTPHNGSQTAAVGGHLRSPWLQIDAAARSSPLGAAPIPLEQRARMLRRSRRLWTHVCSTNARVV